MTRTKGIKEVDEFIYLLEDFKNNWKFIASEYIDKNKEKLNKFIDVGSDEYFRALQVAAWVYDNCKKYRNKDAKETIIEKSIQFYQCIELSEISYNSLFRKGFSQSNLIEQMIYFLKKEREDLLTCTIENFKVDDTFIQWMKGGKVRYYVKVNKFIEKFFSNLSLGEKVVYEKSIKDSYFDAHDHSFHFNKDILDAPKEIMIKLFSDILKK